MKVTPADVVAILATLNQSLITANKILVLGEKELTDEELATYIGDAKQHIIANRDND
jgi:hypothetical protein